MIEGAEEIIKQLQDLGWKDGEKIVRAGLKAGGKIILPVVKSLAAKHRKTGTMDANLKARFRKNSVKIGAAKKDFKGKAFYTPAVLFGHRVGKRPTTRAGRKALKQNDPRPFVPGDDFIKQAQDQVGGAAEQAAIQAMEQEIAKITKQ